MVNHLNKTKIVGRPTRRPPQPPQIPPNEDGSEPPQPLLSPVPALNVEVTIPLKYLSNFWRFLDL